MMREDAVGPRGRGHQDGVRPESRRRDATGHHGVHAAGDQRETPRFEMVFQPLHRSRSSAGRSEGSGGLVEREDGMRGKEFDGFHFTIRASIGDGFPYIGAERQVQVRSGAKRHGGMNAVVGGAAIAWPDSTPASSPPFSRPHSILPLALTSDRNKRRLNGERAVDHLTMLHVF